jgi:hypothetical protein
MRRGIGIALAVAVAVAARVLLARSPGTPGRGGVGAPETGGARSSGVTMTDGWGTWSSTSGPRGGSTTATS